MLAGRRVLDMGAGTGGFAKVARTHGVDVISIDTDSTNFRNAFAGGRKQEKDVPYARADMTRLPFSNNTFDIVLSHASVHWAIDTPEKMRKMLQETRRVMRPGGVFRFTPGHYANLAHWVSIYQSPINRSVLQKAQIADLALVGVGGMRESSVPFMVMDAHVRQIEPQAKLIVLVDAATRRYHTIFWQMTK